MHSSGGAAGAAATARGAATDARLDASAADGAGAAGHDPVSSAGTRGAEFDAGSPPVADDGSGAVGDAGPAEVSAGGGDSGASGAPLQRMRDPVLPRTTEPCPMLANGHVMILGRDVQLWVGAPRMDVKGSVYLYWHATGTDSTQTVAALGGTLDEIVKQGGIVAAVNETLGTGQNTSGTGVWYSDDFTIADRIVACAVQQLNIDEHRIYTGGCAGGADQAAAMVYLRSSYLAAAAIDTGGIFMQLDADDPEHVPSVLLAVGRVVPESEPVDYAGFSAKLRDDLRAKGGILVQCSYTARRCVMSTQLADELGVAEWRFLQDHPFGIDPPPYSAGLPADFPSYCQLP